MSDRAPIPNLPPISSIKDPDVRVALESMWNAWRVRNGDVGDGEHKFLTAADLTDAFSGKTASLASVAPFSTGGVGSGIAPNTSWVRPFLSKIDDYIQQSWLWKKLGERIDWIETPEWFIENLDRSIGTTIKNEQKIREAADSSLASSITSVSAVLNNNIALVKEELTANVTLTEATATKVTTLQTEFDANKAQVQNSITVLTSADQSLTSQINQAISDYNGQISGVRSEISTVSNSVSALSQSTTTNFANVNNNLSLIRTDVNSVTDLAGSNASKITTLQTSVSGVKTSAENALSLASTTEGKVNGAWTVKFDANGYVTGAGLGLEGKNGNYQSSFYVRADKFAIGNPQYPNVTPKIPFKVFSTAQNINGTNVPPGVYIDSAVIADGTIDNAKIGFAAVGTLELEGNAVTVPTSNTERGIWGGNGGFQNINIASITNSNPSVPMSVVGFVSARQGYRPGYSSGTFIYRVLNSRGSVVTDLGGMTAVQDMPSFQFYDVVPASSTTNYYVQWYSSTDKIEVNQSTLTLLGVKR